MSDALQKLDELAAAGKLHGFTLWRSHEAGDFQANLQTGRNAGWRVMRGASPSEAITAVLGMDFVDQIDEASGIVGTPIDFGEAAVDQLEAEEFSTGGCYCDEVGGREQCDAAGACIMKQADEMRVGRVDDIKIDDSLDSIKIEIDPGIFD